MESQVYSISRRTIGLLLLLCVVCIWVGSSFLVSNLFGEQQYNHPFFVTYINTSTFSLYLLDPCISRIWRAAVSPSPRKKRSLSDDEGAALVDDDGVIATDNQAPMVTLAYPEDTLPRLTSRETIRLGISFCILWFAANITQNASLAYTSVANSSILCSTSGLFTLIIGAIAGVEHFDAVRLAAVLASVVGVYSIMKYGQDSESLPMTTELPLSWLGDTLALLSAVLYGCYTTLLKRRIGDESRLDTPLFFGSVGLANLLLLWPGLVLLDYTGIEPFLLPQTAHLWAMILINALVGTFLSDYLWLMAVLMTSPLVVTLGLSLTIPLSMAGDIVFKGLNVSFAYYLGALLILSAFIAANIHPH